ncbi:hypothetical protein [Butyrivibrio sp. INlla16]|uniref:hypothetical protein n=1 Tax=Butyrivibrio sp. INlla16 TaxID=1520807 RepID=UPI000890F32F|nr:hypothetical protein [Butyrivibrio sp. INlla16]SDB45228.1 hypothetical protein SAMN02910263_02204 [Butyrivibrio sp. INlla16]
MKGIFFKKICNTVVAVSVMAAAINVNMADSLSVCAQEVSSGDSFEISDNSDMTQIPEAVQIPEIVQEPETVQDTDPATLSEKPDGASEDNGEEAAEIFTVPEPTPLSETGENVSSLTVQGTPDATFVYDGAEHTVTVSLAGSASDEQGNSYTIAGSGTAATVTVTAKNVKDSSFTITDLTGITVTNSAGTVITPASLTVNAAVITKKDVTLRSMNLLKTYDGKPLENGETPLAEETGWVSGEGAYYSFTGSRTAIGTGINEFTITPKDGTDFDNYNISRVFGDISVVERTEDQKYIITVEAGSSTVKYNGSLQSVSGYVLEGRSSSDFQVNGTGDPSQVITVTIGDSTFNVTGIAASAAGKNAGEYSVDITGSPVVRDAEGNDVTSQFRFEFKPGKFTIEKRYVVLTSASAKKKYNNKTLKKHKVTVSGDGFAEGEGATYEFTGKQKEIGESYNYFTYKLNDGTLADNYDIEKVPGVLKVKKPDDVAINEEPKYYDDDDNDSTSSEDTSSSGEAQNTASNAQSAPASGQSASGEQAGANINPAEAAPADTANAGVNDPNVLGAKRGSVTVDIANPTNTGNKKNVLGARRGATDDSTGMERHIIVFAAAVVLMAALKIKRDKRLKK